MNRSTGEIAATRHGATKRSPGGALVMNAVAGCAALALLLAGLTPSTAAHRLSAHADSKANPAPLHQRINGMMGLRESVLQYLPITSQSALDGAVNITIDGALRRVTYWHHSVRSDCFQVRIQGDDGSLVKIDAAPPRTIRGVVDTFPGSTVVGSLLDDGLHATIFLPDGRVLWIEPIGGSVDNVAAGWHVLYDAGDAACRKGTFGVPIELNPSPRVSANPPQAAFSIDCMVAQIAVDADFDLYLTFNSDEAAVLDHIEAIINTTNIQYENEVGIVHEITEVVIRTSAAQNPYTTNDPAALLHQFRSVWNSEPEASIERDLAHLFTGRVLNAGILGFAFHGVVCDVSNAYGLTRYTSIPFSCQTDILARYLAFNWAAMPCDCPGTTMHMELACANTFIGPGSNAVDEILAYKDSVDCLDPCDPFGCRLADLNCDGSVGVADLVILIGAWGPCDDCDACQADLTGNCNVGVADLIILINNWG